MMKKISLWLLALVCLVALVACDIVDSDFVPGMTDATTSAETASEEITSEEITSEEITSEEITSEEITSEEITSDEITSEEITTEEVTTEEVTTEDVTTEDVTTEDVTTEDVTTGSTEPTPAPSLPAVSFVFEMTEDDLEELEVLCATVEALALDGADVGTVADAFDKAWEQYEYITAQSMIAYVNYYADLSSAETAENYTLADRLRGEAVLLFNDTLAELSASGGEFADVLFEGWSEEDIADLHADNETVVALMQANTALTMEYLSLPENENWDAEVNRIYEQFVANYNAIAREYGYDSYYEYASVRVQGRDYSAADRAAFRQYVQDYIVPLCADVSERYYALLQTLTEEQFNTFYALVVENYDSDTWETDYVRGYVATFDRDMYACMVGMLDGDVSVFTDSDTAYPGALTTYLSYYGQTIAYFGPGYQDMLTVIHENGHYAACGVYGSNMPCLDLCETHSQANEWLFLSYLQGQGIDPAVCEILTLYHLYNSLESVVYSTAVDECEELIYGAGSLLDADDYDELLTAVKMSYGAYVAENCNIEYYFKCVAINSPVYYISYATSQLASMSLYTVAAEDYAAAQEMYVALIEGAASGDGFVAGLLAAGFSDPFDEATFVALGETFGAVA